MERTRTYRVSTSSCTGGFSFLEIVVALAVLSVLAAALLHACVELLRARARVDLAGEARLVMTRIAGESSSGVSPEIVATNCDGWNVEYEETETAFGTNRARWTVWTIFPADRPSQRAQFCTRSVSNRTSAR